MADYHGKIQMLEALRGGLNPERKAMVKGVIADLMAPLEEWPYDELQFFLGPHLKFKGRCRLVWFWAVNAGPPETLKNWAKAQPGYLRNDKAVLHFANLFEAWKRGDFEGDNGNPMREAWSMEHKMKVPVYTPLFAFEDIFRSSFEMAGNEYWDAPIRDLKVYARMVPRKIDQERAKSYDTFSAAKFEEQVELRKKADAKKLEKRVVEEAIQTTADPLPLAAGEWQGAMSIEAIKACPAMSMTMGKRGFERVQEIDQMEALKIAKPVHFPPTTTVRQTESFSTHPFRACLVCSLPLLETHGHQLCAECEGWVDHI